MILSFPCSEPGHICIKTDPFVFGMSVLDLPTLIKCRAEVNFQNISTTALELLCDVYPMRNEHVVAFENNISVDLNRGERVEAIENKFVNLSFSGRSNTRKLCSVGPIFVGHPFTFELVET